jgi:hypothetical protein
MSKVKVMRWRPTPTALVVCGRSVALFRTWTITAEIKRRHDQRRAAAWQL